jgi:hypothetical protein
MDAAAGAEGLILRSAERGPRLYVPQLHAVRRIRAGD